MSTTTIDDFADSAAATGTSSQRLSRITSLDVLRGVAMVLMAIDHVRVYSGLPAGGPTPGIFFTRWITHFCAPTFVFFAGTGAFLHGRKLNDRRALARYLVSRGLVLVILELTLVRFAWTFNFDYSNFVLAGVLWMLGWCMVILAGLIWLPTSAIGVIGLVIIFFQQAFHFIPRIFPETIRNSIGWIWEFIYPAGLQRPPGISVLYVLVPWIGVMAAGYAFGAIMIRNQTARSRICLWIGLSATALFLIFGGLAVFKGFAFNESAPAVFRLLDQQKYPASQLYLLMTLGPTIALLPLAERARGWFIEVLKTFGRVPLFYYMVHIPVIHISALVVWYLRDHDFHTQWFASAPFVSVPLGARWSLGLLYIVYVVVVVLLYFPCRWFAGLKARRRSTWLSYI